MAEIPLSLYVHFPWCVRKCPYCDFNSHALSGELPEAAYIEALVRDLEHDLADLAPRRIVSIFLGGGTPSLFSGQAIGTLLGAITQRADVAPDAEITLEANPGTADESNFAAYRAAGVNRLSIGVQSLDARHLARLGRIHDPDQARRAMDSARRAGFDNVNLDLMYALPEQTLDEARRDLTEAITLGPAHLSYYHLTLEPNTEFHARPPPLPDADLAWDMQEQGEALLAQHGFGQYEVSAYARAGRQCRHNRNYWEYGDYLGIGAGAHAKVTRDGGIRRRAKRRHPRAWLEGAGTGRAIQEDRAVARADLPFEFAMNALRLNDGFDVRDFESRTGESAAALRPALDEARRRGWIDGDSGRVRVTRRGRALLNDVLSLFLP